MTAEEGGEESTVKGIEVEAGAITNIVISTNVLALMSVGTYRRGQLTRRDSKLVQCRVLCGTGGYPSAY